MFHNQGKHDSSEKRKAHHEDEPYEKIRFDDRKLLLLFADLHNVTGLELDGQPIGMHGYFPDPVPY